jgi:putative acetyltransferase
MTIVIREEQPGDAGAIRIVNEMAFGQPAEAGIVDQLRAACPGMISLVALSGAEVIGHILFTPAFIQTEEEDVRGMGLAPMAVLPPYQRQGVGSRLVEAVLEALRARDCPFVIVLGHPGYYPRFGFLPASRRGIACQWDGVPDEAFMLIIFDERRMAGVTGVARYREEFNEGM